MGIYIGADRFYARSSDGVFPVHIAVLGQATEGFSRPAYVSVALGEKVVTGFQKLDQNSCLDNGLECVLAKIGRIIHIPVASVLRIYRDVECFTPYSSISISVSQKKWERFVCFREMRDELFWDLQAGKISMSSWIKAWKQIRERNEHLVPGVWEVEGASEGDYDVCLQFPFEIAELWTRKHGIKLENFDASVLKMLIFDLLVGQADRTPSNYGLLIDLRLQTGQLAPLFDNSTLRKEYMADTQNGFNQMLLERAELAAAVRRRWGTMFVHMVRVVLNEEGEIIRTIDRSNYLLSPDTKAFLKRRITASMQLLCSIADQGWE